jgi:hypothetical protein
MIDAGDVISPFLAAPCGYSTPSVRNRVHVTDLEFVGTTVKAPRLVEDRGQH